MLEVRRASLAPWTRWWTSHRQRRSTSSRLPAVRQAHEPDRPGARPRLRSLRSSEPQERHGQAVKKDDREYLRRVIVFTAFAVAFSLYGCLAAVYVSSPWLLALPVAVGLVIGLGLEAVRRRL